MDWHAHLQARLRAIRPDSVCALDAAAHQLARSMLHDVPVHAPSDSETRPCALALGIDALNGLDAPQARHLISQVRLYTAPRILVAAQPGCTLDEAAFLALGFTLSLDEPAAGLRFYYYDLETYKTVPDWLNARFWANPDRWEP